MWTPEDYVATALHSTQDADAFNKKLNNMPSININLPTLSVFFVLLELRTNYVD